MYLLRSRFKTFQASTRTRFPAFSYKGYSALLHVLTATPFLCISMSKTRLKSPPIMISSVKKSSTSWKRDQCSPNHQTQKSTWTPVFKNMQWNAMRASFSKSQLHKLFINSKSWPYKNILKQEHLTDEQPLVLSQVISNNSPLVQRPSWFKQCSTKQSSSS